MMLAPAVKRRKGVGRRILREARRNFMLYLFLLPTLAYLFVFHYWPMYGIQIAFRKFTPALGISGSQWMGFYYIRRFFSSFLFKELLLNTIALSVYQLIAGFPLPVILALLLGYTAHGRLRKITQTVTYAPHFISTVVLVGMLNVFLAPKGVINQLTSLWGAKPVLFLGRPELFRHIYVWSHIWQRTGWNSVIYIAALASVSPELHEAATVDGASKLRRIWHVDLPALMPTMIILLILNTGNVLSIGFEKAFLMQNDINLKFSEIISTYVYKVGLVNAEYSYSTAIGLFNNIINFVILMAVNAIAGKVTGNRLV